MMVLRQRVFAIEPVEIGGERVGLRPVADGVEAGVAARVRCSRRVLVLRSAPR